MTRNAGYVAECFGWWDDEKRRLEHASNSGRRIEPWYDFTSLSSMRKNASSKLLDEFAFVRWPELRTRPRKEALRIVRRRGWRIVKVRVVPFEGAGK